MMNTENLTKGEFQRLRQRLHVQQHYYSTCTRINTLRVHMESLQEEYTQVLRKRKQLSEDASVQDNEGKWTLMQSSALSVESYIKLVSLKDQLRLEQAMLKDQLAEYDSSAFKMDRIVDQLDDEKAT